MAAAERAADGGVGLDPVSASVRSMRYAHLAPDVQAGTVNVHCLPDGQATLAEITYDLTALRATTEAALQQFADRYDTFLSEWERLIAAALERAPRAEDS